MLGYLSSFRFVDMLGYVSKLTIFLELCSLRTAFLSEQMMSADKYLRIFSREMEAIVCRELVQVNYPDS